MVTISKCGNNDIPLLLDIAIRSYRETYEYLWDDKGDAYIRRFYSTEILEREMAMDGVNVFLVYYDGEAAGYLKTTENTPAPDENKIAWKLTKSTF